MQAYLFVEPIVRILYFFKLLYKIECNIISLICIHNGVECKSCDYCVISIPLRQTYFLTYKHFNFQLQLVEAIFT